MFEDQRRLEMPGMDKDAAEAGTVVCQLLRPDFHSRAARGRGRENVPIATIQSVASPQVVRLIAVMPQEESS